MELATSCTSVSCTPRCECGLKNEDGPRSADIVRLNTINLNGAVSALCALAIFSLAQDDLERNWRYATVTSFDWRQYYSLSSLLIVLFFIAISGILASVAATRKWRVPARSTSTVRVRITDATDLV